MKKTILCILLITTLLFTLAACGQSSETTTQLVDSTLSQEKAVSQVEQSPNNKEESKPHIKVVEKWSDAYGGGKQLDERSEFDRDGNLLKKDEERALAMTETEEYAYDDDGRTIKYQLTESGEVTSLKEYEYVLDSCGNVIKEISHDILNELTYTTREVTYNSVQKVINGIYYNRDGTVNYSYENEFNSDGKLIKTIHYDADRTETYITEYEYDSDGNRIKSNEYSSGDRTNPDTVRFYNINGEIVEEQEYDPDSGDYRTVRERKYNNRGELICTLYYSSYSGNIGFQVTLYDASGNTFYTVHDTMDYVCDDDGYIKEVRQFVDINADLRSWITYYFEYDANGLITEVKYPNGYNIVGNGKAVTDSYGSNVYTYEFW